MLTCTPLYVSCFVVSNDKFYVVESHWIYIQVELRVAKCATVRLILFGM